MLLELLPPPEHDPGQVRDLAREILSRPEFRERPPSLVERVTGWIGDLVRWLFEQVTGAGGGSTGYVVAIVVVILAVWALTRVTRTVRRDPAPREEVILDSKRSAAAWRADAESLEAKGAFKEAMRSRYRALVTDLVERGVLQDIAGRTAGEYRVEYAGAVPDTAPDFSSATDLFERAWYGDRPTGPDESQRFRQHESRVLTGVGR